VYAAFRGETIEQFQATRKVSMRYSVAGAQQVRAIDQA
jgi:gallate dioxygenase